MLLDRLEPEAAARGRALMVQELTLTRERFWGNSEDGAPPLTYVLARKELSRVDVFFKGLKPASADRTTLEQARGLGTSIVQTHLLMGRQLQNPVPTALINSVVLWAVVVFICVGLGATLNAVALIWELLGAVSVAGAVFLVLEFSQRYVGYFRIPPTRIDQAIASLSGPQA